ncbi:MAG: hypothetical protein LBG78_04440 [Azoarcus sp.]|jgi:uncharacterized protein YecT (DUF1311 family)|nr:hypothetical protein [Azoarcus sp.]
MAKTLIVCVRILFVFFLCACICTSFAVKANNSNPLNLSEEEKIFLTEELLKNKEFALFVCAGSFEDETCNNRTFDEVLNILFFGDVISENKDSGFIYVEPHFNTKQRYTGFFRKNKNSYTLICIIFNNHFRIIKTAPLTIQTFWVTDNITLSQYIEEYVIPENEQIAVLVSSTQSFITSFDCTKASTTIEKMICNNETLASLDRLLSVNYQTTLEQVSDNKALVIEQRAWLKSRMACKTEDCLIKSYQERILQICRKYLKACNE